MCRVCLRLAFACALALLGACGTLIAPYDEAFDQSLNKFSDDTAKFLAAAYSGGPERSYAAKETTAYYASAYNLLDRLSARAALSRASFPCPADQALKQLIADQSTLPTDYEKFDCREVQLFALRIYIKQLDYAHKEGATLNRAEVKAAGGPVQVATLGAIQTFLVNKPTK